MDDFFFNVMMLLFSVLISLISPFLIGSTVVMSEITSQDVVLYVQMNDCRLFVWFVCVLCYVCVESKDTITYL